MAVKTSSRLWGQVNGADVFLFRIGNESGAYVELTNYGAAIVSIVVPDKQQQLENVVVGFPDLERYLNDTCYIGSTIGRYANRISNARFRLDGKIYQLDANDGKNSNHAGKSGFNYRVFTAETIDNGVVMTLTSADGDGGYPGTLELMVIYTWSDDNELMVSYKATTDKATIANFTNHAYFNLSAFKSKIYNHKLTVLSEHIVDSYEDYTPSGAIIPAKQKAFNNDKLGDKFKIDESQVEGLNLFYVINREAEDNTLANAALLIDETSGRSLEVYTDYPGIFLYTGDYLSSTAPTHTGKPAKPFDALCLECQHYPDSINHPNFPQAILQAGDVYDQSILYKFGTI
ncbi:aldose epimerase family protein [Mucilaginibacter sp. cycad4]|uniref:aldose epimerase family protein n=1 Tax=Mucilaginibacter sp. cycad4 TaxID=3342096 RepID=UPI002AAB6E52|nr:aldose epimerase family protein [Mucilaginibacter gossypii]WPU97772.1 aldose epimerase family protein [Mucilaginibacter gossypii]